ncbi:MAG: tyrosine-type recombinase/integrase [Gemmataceae bacterium]
MATIGNDPNGRRRILFVAPDGKRKTIRLGKCDRKTADGISRHVESLLASAITGQPVARETASWLKTVSLPLKKKLAEVGLIEAPKQTILGEFLRGYILSRPDVKPATLEVWQQPCRNLLTFFGENKPLRSITAGDGDQFKAWLLTQKLAPATLAKRLSFARTFLHVARKHKLIEENPFSEVKIPPADVSERQHFVSREVMNQLLEAANPTWRTIIALTRYGGLRCPSEVLSLQWCHIDWKKSRITVISPKTDRYEGKASRIVPLFAELRPFLLDAFELAVPGQTHVVGGGHLAKAQGPNGWRNCNLRTSFEKLIGRAGLESWPRLFHNLRSSRETELLEQFPVHVVAKWMGHDPKVSLKHYAQTTDDHFERAAGGTESGTVEAQKPAQQGAAASSADLPSDAQGNDHEGSCARSCESARDSEQMRSGEGGKRGGLKNGRSLSVATAYIIWTY